MRLKEFALFVSLVGFTGMAFAQSDSTKQIRGCTDRDINRQVARKALRIRSYENLAERQRIADDKHRMQREEYNQRYTEIQSGMTEFELQCLNYVSESNFQLPVECRTKLVIKIVRTFKTALGVYARYERSLYRNIKALDKARARINLETERLNDLYSKCRINPPQNLPDVPISPIPPSDISPPQSLPEAPSFGNQL